MSLRFTAMPTQDVRALQNGGKDANGHVPERHISDGTAVPCRHCLTNIAKGDPFLILAHRPFPELQPYAELGPIFLHADADQCPRYGQEHQMPAMYRSRHQLLLKGYRDNDRIYYGTGQIVEPAVLEEKAAALLEDPDVAYIHVRSATNNCYQFRIDRA